MPRHDLGPDIGLGAGAALQAKRLNQKLRWVGNMETRLDRLMRAAEIAGAAQQQLLVVEAMCSMVEGRIACRCTRWQKAVGAVSGFGLKTVCRAV